MSDPKSKEPPAEVQKVMASMFEALMNKVKSLAKQVQVHSCDVCGAKDCVQMDPENVYENVETGFKMKVPALLCSECGSVGYEPRDYGAILEAEEAAQGRPYIRVEVKDGQLHKHTLH